MPILMILRRMWREWRLMGVLLLALCLVTGFLALGPLYVRAVSESGVRFSVENTAPERLNITLANPTPLGNDAWEILGDELGGVVTNITRVVRSTGILQRYVFNYAQPVTPFTGTLPGQVVVAGYSNLDDVFEVVEGRWPVRLATPDEVATDGLTLDQQFEREVGIYTRQQIEAVVTSEVAQQANIEVGARWWVGAETARVAAVRVVGIIEPTLPLDDPFWNGQGVILNGQLTPVGLFERYDFGFIVPEGAYDDWIAPNTNGNSYTWLLTTNPDVIRASTLDALSAGLNRMTGSLRSIYPNIQVIEGISSEIINSFRQGIAETEGPITLLSGAILVLMLYHLVTTVALVLEQQSGEWASIVSRGGSTRQLILMQLVSMGLLGLIAFVVGPFLGLAMLAGLARLGPLTAVLGEAAFDLNAIPLNAFLLSGVAALLGVIVLTLPAWPAARSSLLRLKQLISRPPTRPAWARYLLDLVFLALGLAFMLRLYFLIGGDLGQSLDALRQDPARLIRLIAENAGQSGGLSDPFNLLGPALLLTGVALLWLRLFPLLMRLIARFFRSSNGLTMPLALWNVERDPGHYAQLVLLLIGTLALGTASLGLAATRDVGAWAAARQETGADMGLELNPRLIELEQNWDALPSVTSSARLVDASTAQAAGRPRIYFYGLDPLAFGEAYPDLANVVAPLADAPARALPGLILPEDAATFNVQVYAESSDPATQTMLNALFIDSVGTPFSLALTTIANTDSGRFVTYTGNLPVGQGRAPWRLTGFQITSQRGELADFSHTIYLDDITTVNGVGESAVALDFESDLSGWAADFPETPSFGGQTAQDLQIQPGDVQAVSGSQSMRIDYRVRQAGGGTVYPRLAFNRVQAPPVPVVISEALAALDSRATLAVGDSGSMTLILPGGDVNLNFEVVGVVDEFPTLTGRDRFLLTRYDALLPVVNNTANLSEFYDWNRVWLDLETREPSADLRLEVAGLPGVTAAHYAWDRYNDIQREPLPNAITGMLFAGFWVSLGLSVLDFGFYLVVTARRRAISFAVLRAIGWERGNIWGLLVVEQATLITPALLVGVALGSLLAYLLLPFLELVGSQVLSIPLWQVGLLLLALVMAFTLLLAATALALQRMNINQVLRLGEE